MKKNELDHIDFEILKMLQANARIPLKEIAAKVYLSSPAVSARIETLVNKGYIEGFHAQINPEVIPQDKKKFYPYIKECKNVVECNCVTGDYSMLLEVLFQSTSELDQFIGELQEYGRTNTLIVFSTSVEHRGVIIE